MKVYGLDKNTITDSVINHKVTFAVYGLGKMGLPLSMVLAGKGATVIGVDINQNTVDEINNGHCPVLGEPRLPEMVEENVKRHRFSATTNGTIAAKDSDVMIILVPSYLDKEKKPDLSAITKTCHTISQGLSKGDFVILETTVPPRTTRDIVLPILKQSGLKEGEFGLAFCPERTSSGRAIKDISGAYPKVVSGIDQKSVKTAEAIYSVINTKGVVAVSSTTAAEAVKVFEGIYRDVNIGLSNELALVCREIGVYPSEVFKIANEPINEITKHPYTNFLQPGAGVGGHCIPVYPYFVTKTTQTDTCIIEAARKQNEYMPHHMINLITEGLRDVGKSPKDSSILLLGLAFRNGVKEYMNSPAIPIIQRLKELHANIFLNDPLFSRGEIEILGVKYGEGYDDMDCLVIITNHEEYKKNDWLTIGRSMRNKVIIDGRGIVDPSKMRELGFVYKGIGLI